MLRKSLAAASRSSSEEVPAQCPQEVSARALSWRAASAEGRAGLREHSNWVRAVLSLRRLIKPSVSDLPAAAGAGGAFLQRFSFMAAIAPPQK